MAAIIRMDPIEKRHGISVQAFNRASPYLPVGTVYEEKPREIGVGKSKYYW